MDFELTGTYPIILGDAECGEVSVSRVGLFWQFEAKCDMRGELLRLSVYGEDAEGYLGLLAPEDGKLRLRKKLSRSGISGFPRAIKYASLAGQPLPRREPEPAPEVSEECEADNDQPIPQQAPIPPPAEIFSPPDDNIVKLSGPDNPPEHMRRPGSNLVSPFAASNSPISASTSPLRGGISRNSAILSPPDAGKAPESWRSCPLPCSLFSDIEAKSAAGGIRGAMSCSGEGGCTRLAVPLSEAHAIGSRSVLRFNEAEEIGGTTYVVCKIKNGKPV